MNGKIRVVGIGPGGKDMLTPEAEKAIRLSDAIVGYTVYVDLIKDMIGGKESFTTGMKQEVDRCRKALDLALKGRDVCFVCSGDPGVYGMAGIMLEVAEDHPEVEIDVVPGITAACSGAAVLGAPLIHDFAVISLSDLLTPKELIAKRIRAAAEADFVICLYNPKSKKRHDYLAKAVGIIKEYRKGSTPSGYVKKIEREGEESRICTLDDLASDDNIDMFTTVFIGNSNTRLVNGRLVTPRGYKNVR